MSRCHTTCPSPSRMHTRRPKAPSMYTRSFTITGVARGRNSSSRACPLPENAMRQSCRPVSEAKQRYKSVFAPRVLARDYHYRLGRRDAGHRRAPPSRSASGCAPASEA